ncbi:hypothetical protein [Limnohabitans sp. 15K]|uniref:hypothetical protein n=1 Tax=Limnohabitans sp. 15K TaxID=1100706 RepID=UPI0018ECAFD7|nr:hypothetical protein [Limnohabitans sp. 15K]
MPDMPAVADQPNRGPNCWQCRHFAITHIPSSPYACRSMGFQSRLLPSLEVLRVDGQFCRLFLAKEITIKA